MLLKVFAASLFVLGLGSCSMPSVGYFTKIDFKGALNKTCVEAVFLKVFPNMRKTDLKVDGLRFTALTDLSLQKILGEAESLKMHKSLSWYAHESAELNISSSFRATQPSYKTLKKLKSNSDAVNFLSHKVYQDLTNFTDEVVKTCKVVVNSRVTKCHSYGRLKKYFKCRK